MTALKDSEYNFIEMAKEWASTEWQKVSTMWMDRADQDYAYRKYVIEPSLSELISTLNLSPSSSIVEIGCGDGSHSLFWRRKLNDLGLESARVFGVDLLESLIIKARANAKNFENISFAVADAVDFNTAKLIHDTIGKPDVIVSMFLMQDIPDLEGVLRMVNSCLKKGGQYISVIVNPNFALHLADSGCVKRYKGEDLPPEHISESGVVQWHYVGYYPIVQADKPPFYLPYFHRSITDYHEAFQKSGFRFSREMIMMPDPNRLKMLQEERIDPFCKKPFNVYWPYIINEPSSLLIHAVCQGRIC